MKNGKKEIETVRGLSLIEQLNDKRKSCVAENRRSTWFTSWKYILLRRHEKWISSGRYPGRSQRKNGIYSRSNCILLKHPDAIWIDQFTCNVSKDNGRILMRFKSIDLLYFPLWFHHLWQDFRRTTANPSQCFQQDSSSTTRSLHQTNVLTSSGKSSTSAFSWCLSRLC